MKKCCIVIPIYHYDLYDYEILSYKNLITLYANKYDLIFITPSNDVLQNFFNKIENFNISYLYTYYVTDMSSIEKYSFYLKTPTLYSCLKDNYEYMLIHQLDAFLFKDELDYWCNKEYDYIGAFDFARYYNCINVFNGGLSLRKISTFYNISMNSTWLDYNDFTMAEDFWWTNQNINICKISDAIKFSWNTYPELYYHINDFSLPFGCHWINRNSWLLNKCYESYNNLINK